MITIVITTNPKTPTLSIEAPALARLCCKLRIPKFKVSSKPFTFIPLFMFLPFCMRTYIRITCMHAYIHTYIHTVTYSYIYIHIFIYLYLSTYIHTFIHACMHTFIHTVQDMYIFSREVDVCT